MEMLRTCLELVLRKQDEIDRDSAIILPS